MLADRADLRRTGALRDVPAVEAHPFTLHITHKELARFQKVGKLAEAVPMGLLDAGDLGEDVGDLGEALLLGHVGKAGVIVLKLLVLVVLGRPKMLQQRGVQVDGVAAVDGDVLPGELGKLVVENLGVGQLLVGGEGKHRLNDVQVVLFGHTGGEGVAVPGLALSGKGPEKVLLGLALSKFNGHDDPSHFMDRVSMPGTG